MIRTSMFVSGGDSQLLDTTPNSNNQGLDSLNVVLRVGQTFSDNFGNRITTLALSSNDLLIRVNYVGPQQIICSDSDNGNVPGVRGTSSGLL